MTHAKKRESAESTLRGVIYQLDQWDGSKPKDLVLTLRKQMVDVVELLQKPNSDLKHLGFIVLAFQQSTKVEVTHQNGKRITRVSILDKDLYEWALEQVHKLAGVSS